MGDKQNQKRWKKVFNEECLTRDRNKCVFCEVKDNLDVHHIVDRGLMPNGGFVKSNGITLCSKHHWDAEHFHMTGESLPGFSPDELYKKINSSYDKALRDSNDLK